MSKILLLIIINLMFVTTVSAAFKNLPIPRFVSIKFDEANARTGPVNDCPIEWVFVKKGEPVEIIAEYEKWRKIRDINDEGGWVHSSVISGKRSVIIVAKNTIALLAAPAQYDQIIAKLAAQIRCAFYQCKKDWCQVRCKSYKGWVARKFLWGVYPDE